MCVSASLSIIQFINYYMTITTHEEDSGGGIYRYLLTIIIGLCEMAHTHRTVRRLPHIFCFCWPFVLCVDYGRRQLCTRDFRIVFKTIWSIWFSITSDAQMAPTALWRRVEIDTVPSICSLSTRRTVNSQHIKRIIFDDDPKTKQKPNAIELRSIWAVPTPLRHWK